MTKMVMGGNAEMSPEAQMAELRLMVEQALERMELVIKSVAPHIAAIQGAQDRMDIELAAQGRALASQSEQIDLVLKHVDLVVIACRELAKTLTAIGESTAAVTKLSRAATAVRRGRKA